MGSLTATEQVRETKAQKVERLKREKNPWEAFEEIRRLRPARARPLSCLNGPAPISNGGGFTRKVTVLAL